MTKVLTDLQSKLRGLPQYLFPNVMEGWLRQYQVLPGRTHPMMVMSGSGGCILHAIKVFDDPEAIPAPSQRHRAKKQRVASEDPQGATAPTGDDVTAASELQPGNSGSPTGDVGGAPTSEPLYDGRGDTSDVLDGSYSGSQNSEGMYRILQ